MTVGVDTVLLNNVQDTLIEGISSPGLWLSELSLCTKS